MPDLQLPNDDDVTPPAPLPLGPGDDDPRSPARVVGPPTARSPLGPGESDGPNPDEGFVIVAPLPPGPGDDATGPRQVVRFPKPQPPEPAAGESDNETE